ncbi:MAG: glycosyltransferase family 2 protein [Polyangiaceae bacterium]|nr:glycosyltransferase family 2 protein [Polyangiaceae bacterium]
MIKSSVIGCTLNEIEAVQAVLPKITKDLADEVIIVDGGSTDGTVQWCKDHGYHVLENVSGGYGAAIRAGVAAAQGDIVIEFPPDGNSLPEKLPEAIAAIESGYDFVIVSRYKDGAKSHDDDFMTAIGNKLFTGMSNLLFGTHYTDLLVGYRAYRRELFFRLGLSANGLSWPAQEAIRFYLAGLKCGEIGGDEPPRIGGQRKMRIIGTGLEIAGVMGLEWLRARRRKG